MSYAGLLQMLRSRLLQGLLLPLLPSLCQYHHFLLTLRGHVTSEWATRWRCHLKRLHRSIRSPGPLTPMRRPAFVDVSRGFILHLLAVFAVKRTSLNFSSGISFTLINTETRDFKAAVIFPT